MSKRKRQTDLAEQLRAAFVESGLSRFAWARRAGVSYAIVHRFAAGDRDIVLLSGGVSAGKYDLVPDALERFGAGRIFHRVAQKPGRPLLLARKGSQLFFGLPGNPLSCHLCFHRYVGAAIRKMEGRTPLPDPASGQLTAAVQPRRSRTRIVLARTERLHQASTDWQIHPLSGASSADMFACCGANCYLEVPPGEAEIRPGEVLRFTWLGSTPWPD